MKNVENAHCLESNRMIVMHSEACCMELSPQVDVSVSHLQKGSIIPCLAKEFVLVQRLSD